MEEKDSIKFLERVFKLLKDEKVLHTEEVKVINFKHPKELKNEINFSLEDTVTDLPSLEALCKKIIKYSVKTSHPNFHNQLYGGIDLFGLGGTWISEGLNTNQHTYEAAPTFILAEQAVIKHAKQKIGYVQGDGIFAPGGSMSNMYGMVLARHKLYPNVKLKGLYGFPPLVVFTSKDAHYSIQKSVHWLGIGTENVVTVETDVNGRMSSQELEKEIVRVKASGRVPFFVNATAGTTVLGAIDPLNALAEICQRHGLWFHVDACFGGTLMLSSKYRDRLSGIQKSDSVAWNPHKMLGAPLQCSLFITKHSNLLHHCNSASANYLFQQDKFYDVSYDTGDKSIQCGRKTDAFKLWVMWKARGDLGFEKLVDNAMEAATYFKLQISNREGFSLLLKDFDTSAVCFFYVPISMRNQDEDDHWRAKLNLVAPTIKEKMIMDGTLMIGYAPLKHKGIGNFFRMVTTCQPPPSFADMDFVITKIEEHGKYL